MKTKMGQAGRSGVAVVRAGVVCVFVGMAMASVCGAQSAEPGASGGDGAKLFQEHCAGCHEPFNAVRAPWPQTLQLMTAQNILQALETGKMQAQGATMSHEERFTLANYLGRHETATATKANACPVTDAVLKQRASRWNGWGVDIENSRYQPEAMAQLTKADVKKLKVKWAYGMAGATGAGGPPTIIGDALYVGGGDGAVHKLNARTGCEYWSVIPSAPARTAISVSDDGKLAYFGDVQARAYAVDTATGKVVWKTELDQHPFAMITGAPKLYAGKLYVPVSSAEELAAANPKYECCTFRGSVAALDAKTGAIVWQTYTIPVKAAPLQAEAGKAKFGPSGAAVWSTPTVDAAKGVLYFDTGDNYAETDTGTSDAVFAVSLSDGKILWTAQLTKDDTYNIGCELPGKGNCPKNAGPDFDIGAPPILRTLGGGRRILIVGQKSGVVYGLDPDDKGRQIWSTRIGKGGKFGGVEFGGAADEMKAYMPLSDWAPDPKLGGGVFALDVATGKQIWNAAPVAPACTGTEGCSAAQPGPATLIPGVVFAGSMDGHMRGYDAGTGAVIWDADTTGKYETVNGVPAHGGSLNYAGAVVAGGMVYVMSGYTVSVGMPGNVVVAFSVEGK
jgi:polyvinyl alcohol dehydrogenase (cytochrome)